MGTPDEVGWRPKVDPPKRAEDVAAGAPNTALLLPPPLSPLRAGGMTADMLEKPDAAPPGATEDEDGEEGKPKPALGFDNVGAGGRATFNTDRPAAGTPAPKGEEKGEAAGLEACALPIASEAAGGVLLLLRASYSDQRNSSNDWLQYAGIAVIECSVSKLSSSQTLVGV
jgi:hypothetical protein